MLTTLLALALVSVPPTTPQSYFLEYRTERSQVQDRASKPAVVSVAASGYGMAAWAIATHTGQLSRNTAVLWINQCLDNTLADNQGNGGWLYHFTTRAGQPTYSKEVSSVDTAIFYYGAKRAAQILDHQPLRDRVERLIAAVDRNIMLVHGYYNHGYTWNKGKRIHSRWDWVEYSEGIIIYKLFGTAYQHPAVKYDLPLFVYYYPLSLCPDDPELIICLGKAIDYQIEHNMAGATACDGHTGYGIMEQDIISPLALASCETYFPKKIKPLLDKLPGRIIPAYCSKHGWTSTDRIGIDDGAYLLISYRPTK